MIVKRYGAKPTTPSARPRSLLEEYEATMAAMHSVSIAQESTCTPQGDHSELGLAQESGGLTKDFVRHQFNSEILKYLPPEKQPWWDLVKGKAPDYLAGVKQEPTTSEQRGNTSSWEIPEYTLDIQRSNNTIPCSYGYGDPNSAISEIPQNLRLKTLSVRRETEDALVSAVKLLLHVLKEEELNSPVGLSETVVHTIKHVETILAQGQRGE